MNSFPADFHSNLTGFGGDPAKNRSQHRDEMRKTPVILVHGNATNSADATFGMLKMKAFLKSLDYRDCEIWAMDYLGENNTTPILQNVHIDHIDRLRTFIDKVRDYLGVNRLDFIAHSLGCGMVNAYLRGLQSNEQWNHENHRFNTAGTFVSLAGAISGLGLGGIDEFRTGSPFERQSHLFRKPGDGEPIADDTPFGSSDPAQQIAPKPNLKQASALDADDVRYVALIARGDFVDAQKPDTGFRPGAHLNKEFNLGAGVRGHEEIIKNQGVFDSFKDHLNQHPPRPPLAIGIDKASGNYSSPLSIGITVTPPETRVDYVAQRVTHAFQAGFIVRTVHDTRTGELSDGQALSMDTAGAWELTLSAADVQVLALTYGVDVLIPEVTILTDNRTRFQNSLEVEASATKGTVYFSFDGNLWNAGANVTLNASTKVYFTAIDADGLASAVVSRFYEKLPVRSETATLLEHFLAHRLNARQFSALFIQFGSNATVTLFFVNDKWVLDPETPVEDMRAPVVDSSLDSGVHASPITVTLTAHHDADAAPRIYYSLDGSEPGEGSPYFHSAGLLRFDTAGTKTLKYRARNRDGNWSDAQQRIYTMQLKGAGAQIGAEPPGGEYATGFDAVISAVDDSGGKLTVYYTRDGSDPSDARNPNRHSFTDKKTFAINGNGNHAVNCYARNRGTEIRQAFAWSVDDQSYPETALAPSMGGIFAGKVEVRLSPSEKCAWTKYTTDGTSPSETNGNHYLGPIVIEQSTVLKFCSKDQQGNLEPVKRAAFTITRQLQQMVFDNKAHRSGYVKADADGSGALVGTFHHLAIGAGRDGKDCRTILSFDTSSLPDNVSISKAFLQIKMHAMAGDVWHGQRHIEVDVQRGPFGASSAIRADDWGAPATASTVASIEAFTSDTAQSGDFSQAGVDAIDTTGMTQIRLRMNIAHAEANNYLFIKSGAEAKLFVEYALVS